MSRPYKKNILQNLAAVLMFGLAAMPTFAQQAAPAAAPTAAQLALGREIVVNSRMGLSFQAVVPQQMDQLNKMLLRTHPEYAKDLNDVLTQLEPGLLRESDTMIDKAAETFATLMNDDDLKATAAFYASSAGKRFAKVQPAAFDQVVVAMKSWREALSAKMLDQVRSEMKKKGHDL